MLEPTGHPAVKPYREALVEDGIPLAQFAVDDVEAEHARLTEVGSPSPNRRAISERQSSPSSTTRAATSFSSSPRNREIADNRPSIPHPGLGISVVDGFCVVYEMYGYRLGVRAHRRTAGGPPFWFDRGVHGEDPSPEVFGREIADFAIAEPLGTIAGNLVMDHDGVGWWGDPPVPGIKS